MNQGGNITFPKSRIESLTDAIFAIAMTLLVLNVEIESIRGTGQWEIFHFLVKNLLPQIMNYIISFVILSLFWIIHHRHFKDLTHINHPLLWNNILILLFIALIPFSTSLIDTHINLIGAAVIFNINIFLLSSLFFLHRIIMIKYKLINPDQVKNKSILKSLIPPLVALIAIILSFISPRWSTLIYLLLPAANLI
ncbi:MAG: TMEM175 family protein [bacterium]